MLYEEASENGFKENKLAYNPVNSSIWVSDFNDVYYVFIKQDGVVVNFKLDDSWDVINQIVETTFELVAADEGRYIPFFQNFEGFLHQIVYDFEILEKTVSYINLKEEMFQLGFNEVRQGATPKFYVMNNWKSVSMPTLVHFDVEEEEEEGERKRLGCEIETDILLNPWLMRKQERPLEKYGVVSQAVLSAKKKILREIRNLTKSNKPKFEILTVSAYYTVNGWTEVGEEEWGNIPDKEGVYTFGIDETGQIWKKLTNEAQEDIDIWSELTEKLCNTNMKDGQDAPVVKVEEACKHPLHKFRTNWPPIYFEMRKWIQVAGAGVFPPDYKGKDGFVSWQVDSKGQSWFQEFATVKEASLPVFCVPNKCYCEVLA